MLLSVPLLLGLIHSNTKRHNFVLGVQTRRDQDSNSEQDPIHLRAERPVRILVRQEDEKQYQEITVNPDETILNALERSGLSELPSDCRRGNCLTCAAKVEGIAGVQSDTGLSQSVGNYLSEKSLILTCSTYVLEPGLSLCLGQHDEAWKQIYQNRISEGEPEFSQSVRARAIRKTAETNVSEWIEETKRVLESSDEE